MENIKLFQKYNDIYIVGYNNLGRNVFNKLKFIYSNKVRGMVVLKQDNISRKAISNENKPIVELDEVPVAKDTLMVIAMDVRFHDNMIIKALENAGFTSYIIYDEEMDVEINSILNEYPRLQTRLLAIIVGQACSLKCKDCANFAPYAKLENMRYSLESIKQEMDVLLPYFEEIDTFHIQGGEPFLYSELADLIYYCKVKYGKILKKIQIATNGTIIPNEAVLNALAQTGAIVRISDYPITTKVNELIETLKKNNISYKYYKFAGNTSEWSDCGKLDYVAPENEDTRIKVQKCMFNTCLTIENGVVGRCARSIPAISLQNIDVKDGDYLFIDEKLSFEKVAKYFMFINPMTCCQHCKGTLGEKIQPAIQLVREQK